MKSQFKWIILGVVMVAVLGIVLLKNGPDETTHDPAISETEITASNPNDTDLAQAESNSTSDSPAEGIVAEASLPKMLALGGVG